MTKITSDIKYIAKAKESKRKKGKEFAKEFEEMRDMSELKALSKLSLEQPLTQKQFERMMYLRDKLHLK